jgi:hypothetical protein
MKSTFLFLFVILSLIVNESIAQNYFYKSYTWEKQPKVYAPSGSDKIEAHIKVKDKTVCEMAYDADGTAVIYETHHTIIHLNNESAIDKVNKVYIPTQSVYEEIDIKARCITADNKILLFNKDGIKRVENLENMGAFTIFPIDGVEAGCDIEYLYTNKKRFYAYAMFNAQTAIPVINYEFTIISPKNLILETKSYNGLGLFVKETSDSTKNILSLKETNLAGFEEEKYSTSEAEKKCFLMQLAYNTAKSNAKFYTWETISNKYYNNLFVTEKNEQKLIEKLLNKNKINQASDQEQKIKALEGFVKANYLISDDFETLPLPKSLDEKKLSETNALKLYITSFKYLQIPFELAFTTNRLNTKFDPKTPSYTYVEDILFYFPEINKYTSPLNIYSRVGYQVNSNLQNPALFIKEINVGDIVSSSSKIKTISGNDYKESYHNSNLKVAINLADQLVKVEVTQMLKGYSAFYSQPIYKYYDDENKKAFEKSMYLIPKTENVKNFTVTNYSEEDLFVKPFTVSYNQETSELLENAGNKYIFKLGELIGQQSELYEEKKRTTEGDIFFSHYLKREIEITIPDGYIVINLEDVIIKKKCILNDKDIAQFESSYKLEGGKLLISVYEDYRDLKYPLNVYGEFKSVINAAADFNKKTLIFEKK